MPASLLCACASDTTVTVRMHVNTALHAPSHHRMLHGAGQPRSVPQDGAEEGCSGRSAAIRANGQLRATVACINLARQGACKGGALVVGSPCFAMQLAYRAPLGLPQRPPVRMARFASCPGALRHALQPFRAPGPVVAGLRSAPARMQATQVEDAPLLAAATKAMAAKAARTTAAAPVAELAATTAPALTPQDLDRVILMQGVPAAPLRPLPIAL